jgi:hypothetical protein
MEECSMSEYYTGYVLMITFAVLIFKNLEKTTWLGAKELPRRDGFMVLYAMVGGGIIYQLISLVQYNLALPPEPTGIGIQNILPIVLLGTSSLVLLSNTLINPTKNFLIAFIIAAITAIACSILFLFIIDFSAIISSVTELIVVGLSMLIGTGAGGIAYLILYFFYDKGKTQLWTLKRYWTVINDYRFLLILVIVVGIETYLQMKFLSILTVFL